MGIAILIVAILAIAGAVVWFFIKKKKEPSVQPEKSVSEPSAPPVDEVAKEDEKEPEKPKFKVGDWAVSKLDGKARQISEVHYDEYNNYYVVESNEYNIEEYDRLHHLWTIQDAKAGDVLVCPVSGSFSKKIIFILRRLIDADVECYCCIDAFGAFDSCINTSNLIGEIEDNDYTPATKEQRDFLFQKMRETGYKWNSKSKQLLPLNAEPSNEEKPKYNEEFESYIHKYSKFVEIKRDTYTYRWFYELFREAKSQLRIDTCHGLPILLKQENFPTLYEWGDKGDAQKAQDTLIGWLFSLQLAELKPYYRADIFKVGYEMGGYDRYTDIYGWKFEYDPNIMRILAGAIYPTMKGWCKPVTETLRREVEGTRYNSTLQQLYDNNSRDNVAPNAFFTDFRVFMPTAPAPYAPAYSKRGDRTYPNEGRDEFDNLKVDRQIHEMIVEAYNLNQPEHYQEVVQAISDKEAEAKHLFGKNRETKNYKFHSVFGEDTIGIELPDEGTLASFAYLVFRTGSSSRGILQSATTNPVQYGRLRPGCSWNQEAKKNSSSDDRRNILTNFEIEDGDGSPTGYYDANGNWVYMDNIHNPEEYEEYQKNALYANSYPSGHSSGIFCCSMVLMELLPNKADKILKAANQYAVNRTITRYHWTSDTINGRVLGAATNAICHAASDYYDMLNKIKKEL